MKIRLGKTLVSGIVAGLLLSGCTPNEDTRSKLDYVDPHIGGVGHLLHSTRPNVQLPNQMIRFHPVRADYLDDQISFFPLTIISHRKGELFGIMPYAGSSTDKKWRERQTWDHDLEIVRPNYYSTYFIDSDIRTEFTPGRGTGYFRFTFPQQADRAVKLQINHDGRWDIDTENSVSGEEWFFGMKAYVYGEFDQAWSDEVNKTGLQDSVVLFEFPKKGNRVVEFRYGISFISAEQAESNFKNEIQAGSFDSLKNGGKHAWLAKLDRIRVKGGTEAQRRTFYTSLYRCYERMVNINENGRYYSAYDHNIHETDRDFYVDMYEQSGWMPQFPLLYGDDPAMHGFHSTIVFLDAWRKGIRGFDVEKAYEGIKKTLQKLQCFRGGMARDVNSTVSTVKKDITPHCIRERKKQSRRSTALKNARAWPSPWHTVTMTGPWLKWPENLAKQVIMNIMP